MDYGNNYRKPYVSQCISNKELYGPRYSQISSSFERQKFTMYKSPPDYQALPEKQYSLTYKKSIEPSLLSQSSLYSRKSLEMKSNEPSLKDLEEILKSIKIGKQGYNVVKKVLNSTNNLINDISKIILTRLRDQDVEKFNSNVEAADNKYTSEVQAIITGLLKSFLKEFVEEAKNSNWNYSPSKNMTSKKIYFTELKNLCMFFKQKYEEIIQDNEELEEQLKSRAIPGINKQLVENKLTVACNKIVVGIDKLKKRVIKRCEELNAKIKLVNKLYNTVSTIKSSSQETIHSLSEELDMLKKDLKEEKVKNFAISQKLTKVKRVNDKFKIITNQLEDLLSFSTNLSSVKEDLKKKVVEYESRVLKIASQNLIELVSKAQNKEDSTKKRLSLLLLDINKELEVKSLDHLTTEDLIKLLAEQYKESFAELKHDKDCIIEKLENDNKKLMQEVKDLQSAKLNIENELEDAKKEAMHLKTNTKVIDELKEKVDELLAIKIQLNEDNNKLKDHIKELDEKKSEDDKMESLLEEMTGRNFQLEDKVEVLEEELKALKANEEETQKQYTSAKKLIEDNYEQKIKELERIIEELKDKEQSASNLGTHNSEDIGKNEFDSHKDEEKDSEVFSADIVMEDKDLVEEFASRELKKEVSEDEMQALLDKLRTLEQEIKSREEIIRDLKATNDTYKEEIDNLNRRRYDDSSSKEELKNHEDLTENYSSMQETAILLEDMTTQCYNQEEQIEELNQINENKDKIIANILEENERITKELLSANNIEKLYTTLYNKRPITKKLNSIINAVQNKVEESLLHKPSEQLLDKVQKEKTVLENELQLTKNELEKVKEDTELAGSLSEKVYELEDQLTQLEEDNKHLSATQEQYESIIEAGIKSTVESLEFIKVVPETSRELLALCSQLNTEIKKLM
jgi:hypothetical protein